mgnify:CR=1 FL=1
MSRRGAGFRREANARLPRSVNGIGSGFDARAPTKNVGIVEAIETQLDQNDPGDAMRPT